MLAILIATIGLAAGAALILDDDENTNETDFNSETDVEVSDDAIAGTSGSDSITGDTDDNSIVGGEGNDTLDGAAGDDRLFGGDGEDLLIGSQGDDQLFGGGQSDIILGEEGDDTLRGGAGNDVLLDTTGEDRFFGDLGRDVIISAGFEVNSDNLSDDLPNGIADLFEALEAETSEDVDSGADTVDGGYGADLMIFGSNDVVTGGNGGDTFIGGSWIEAGNSAIITDFDPEEDQLLYGYDANEGEEPELTSITRDNSDGGTDAIVLADGVEVLHLVDQGNTFVLEEHLALINTVR